MQKLPKKSIVFDVANILFRVASVQKHSNPYARDIAPEDLVGLCMHISIQSIFKWYQKYNPDFVVFGFEGPNNWRKKYTSEVGARKDYKGNRVIDPEMAHYYELVDAFKKTMKSHTSICCLSLNEMEGDDVIAGYCQLYAADDHEIFIVSGDKDFTQLLKLPNVKLIDPDTGKLRNQPGDKHYVEDLDYWMFLKCVRGDTGDHVPSAFPRVRETRVKKAYESEYERANFMNEKWTDENGVEHRVGDLFIQNNTLMNLFEQPEEYRTKLLDGIREEVKKIGHYSHFHFLRFLDQYNLVKLRDDAMKYVSLFANNQRFLKGETAPKTALNKSERQEVQDNSEIIDMASNTTKKPLLQF